MMVRIDAVEVHVCRLPGTTCAMAIVELVAEGLRGIGYTYEPRAAGVITNELAPVVLWGDPHLIAGAHGRMLAATRNVDDPAIAAAAVSAVDIAMWDLRARLLEKPLAALLGTVRDAVTICACAGFGSIRPDSLAREVADYAVRGHRKIAIAVEPEHSHDRIQTARDAAGPNVELLLDGRNTFSAAQAHELIDRVGEHDGVTCFVEPTATSQHLALRFLRETSPIRIAAGRETLSAAGHEELLADACVDILLVDATRCLGLTGFLQTDALCATHGIPMATHGAPAIHIHAALSTPRALHVSAPSEHARIETLLFEGLAVLHGG
ncbi:MAG TPA: enolase C-terminal domain-like protein, partial [Kofleriaceae bacterium]|nr:enolase C-terminal domain-like protein [Kofleriaceae bacterium]